MTCFILNSLFMSNHNTWGRTRPFYENWRFLRHFIPRPLIFRLVFSLWRDINFTIIDYDIFHAGFKMNNEGFRLDNTAIVITQNVHKVLQYWFEVTEYPFLLDKFLKFVYWESPGNAVLETVFIRKALSDGNGPNSATAFGTLVFSTIIWWQ